MRVIVHSITKQYVLDNAEYAWLKDNLGKPLFIYSIGYSSNGTMYSVCIKMEDTCLTLFRANGAELEFVGNLPIGKFKVEDWEEYNDGLTES